MGRELRENEAGFTVHETVSEVEGPITPTFKTKPELIEHLVKHGTAWDEPWTQKQAEHFVNDTGYAPSLILSRSGCHKGYTVT